MEVVRNLINPSVSLVRSMIHNKSNLIKLVLFKILYLNY